MHGLNKTVKSDFLHFAFSYAHEPHAIWETWFKIKLLKQGNFSRTKTPWELVEGNTNHNQNAQNVSTPMERIIVQ